jgi:hypothetical protein
MSVAWIVGRSSISGKLPFVTRSVSSSSAAISGVASTAIEKL